MHTRVQDVNNMLLFYLAEYKIKMSYFVFTLSHDPFEKYVNYFLWLIIILSVVFRYLS